MNVRLMHKTIMGGRYHVITSPDEKGLFIAAPSEAAARTEADAVLRIIRNDRDKKREERLAAESARAFG